MCGNDTRSCGNREPELYAPAMADISHDLPDSDPQCRHRIFTDKVPGTIQSSWNNHQPLVLVHFLHSDADGIYQHPQNEQFCRRLGNYKQWYRVA